MKKLRGTELRWILALMLAVLWAQAEPADAGPKDFNQLLRGDYAFSGEASCLVSIGGFNANLTPVGPPAPFPSVFSFDIQGVRTFNGDGTGMVVGRVVSINHPYALPPSPPAFPLPFFNRGGASSADIQADFTYAVAPDRSFTIQTGTVNGTVLTGTRAGQTFTIVNIQFAGLISKDHKTLTIAHDQPNIETVVYSNGDIQQRICHRARIHLELKHDD